jgi:hypothetical protein
MSSRLSLDVKPAAPSVAPPIARRFADSSNGFDGHEMKFKQPGDKRDLSRCNCNVAERFGFRPAGKFACLIKFHKNCRVFCNFNTLSFAEVCIAFKEITS